MKQHIGTEPGRRTILFLRVLFPLCIAATVAFIFSNSAQVAEVSSGRSEPATAFLNGILARLGSISQFSEHLVRKLGHLCEYALLGLWFVPSLRAYTRRVLPLMGWALLFGLLTAVGDELFQLTVPGRSGQVSDIAIDFGGILAGVLTGWAAYAIAVAVWRARSRRKRAGKV